MGTPSYWGPPSFHTGHGHHSPKRALCIFCQGNRARIVGLFVNGQIVSSAKQSTLMKRWPRRSGSSEAGGPPNSGGDIEVKFTSSSSIFMRTCASLDQA